MNKNLQKQNKYLKVLFLVSFIFLSTPLLYAETIPNGSVKDNYAIEIELQQKITLDVKNKSFTEVLGMICSQSDIKYGVKEGVNIDNNPVFSIKVKGESIENTLKTFLKNTPYDFDIKDNIVLIVGRDAVAATQQDVFTVKGTVKDAQGRPIVGATVIVAYTSTGAITDANGQFNISVKKGQALEVSYVGYKSATEVVDGSKTDLVVTLEADDVKVDDVVVTGMFTKSRESYTGAVSTISKEEIKVYKGQNLLHTLRNIDPAFNIVQDNYSGSNPNVISQVNIRGTSYLPSTVEELNEGVSSTMNTPLIIVDGFEISLQELNDYNDEDIESINIMKDAAATALYGSRGANGVIIIHSRVPEAGKLQFYFKAGYTIELPDLSSYNLLHAADKLALEKAIGLYDGTYEYTDYSLKEDYNEILRDIIAGVDTDWISQPLRTGISSEYKMQLGGGSQEFRWSVSMGYEQEEGVMIGSEKKTFNGSIDLTYNYKNLIFKNKTYMITNKGEESNYGTFNTYVKMNPYWKIYDEDGNYIEKYTGTYYNYTLATNPLYDATLNQFDTDSYTTLKNNLIVEWNVLDGLRAVGKLGVSKTFSNSDAFLPAEHSTFDSYSDSNYARKGSYDYTTGQALNYDASLTLSYTKSFNEKHQIYAGFDCTLLQRDSYSYSFALEGFSDEDFYFLGNAMYYADSTPSGSQSLTRSVGYTANFNYTYDNRYYLDATYRLDGASQYGSDNKFAPFFSVGAGWNLHREDFMQNIDFINSLRLKASYGTSGEQNFSSYSATTTYNYILSDRYGFSSSAYLQGYGNTELKWQTKKSLNIGIESQMLENRLRLSLDVYKSKTINSLSQLDTPLATGFSSYTANIGSIENKGFEMSVMYYILRDTKRNIIWTITPSIAYNEDLITELSDAIKTQVEAYLADEDNADNDNIQLLYEGTSPNTIYAVKSLGIDPGSGQELYLDADGNITYTYDRTAMYAVGVSEPKYRGNINSMFAYKNFSMNVSFGYHWGGQQYNQTIIDRVEISDYEARYNVDERAFTDRWLEPGDVSAYKSYFDLDGNAADDTQKSSRFVQDDNVFTLQSASLQYKWKTDWVRNTLRMQSIDFGVNMSDIFYISTIQRERGVYYPFSRRIQGSISFLF